MPDFTCFFGKREGVIPVGLAVMLSNIGGTPLSSRAQIAKRFDLSKTHVSNMIAEGSRLGFFVTDETGTLRATSHNHLRDSYGRFISIELAFYARHIRPTRNRPVALHFFEQTHLMTPAMAPAPQS